MTSILESLGQFFRVELQHVVRHLTASLPHNLNDFPQFRGISLCEEGYRSPSTACTASSPNPMDVRCRALGKIIVYDQFDAFEVDSAASQFSVEGNSSRLVILKLPCTSCTEGTDAYVQIRTQIVPRRKLSMTLSLSAGVLSE